MNKKMTEEKKALQPDQNKDCRHEKDAVKPKQSGKNRPARQIWSSQWQQIHWRIDGKQDKGEEGKGRESEKIASEGYERKQMSKKTTRNERPTNYEIDTDIWIKQLIW